MNKYAPVFDSHCDTLARSQAGEKFVTGSEGNHIDLPRLLESGVRDQIMAICCEPYTGREEDPIPPANGLSPFQVRLATRG